MLERKHFHSGKPNLSSICTVNHCKNRKSYDKNATHFKKTGWYPVLKRGLNIGTLQVPKPQPRKLNFHMLCDYVSFLCVKRLFKLLSDYGNCHFKLIHVNKTWIPGDSHLEVWMQKEPDEMCVHLRRVQHFLKKLAPSFYSLPHEGKQSSNPFWHSSLTGNPAYVFLYSYCDRNNFPFNNKKCKV